MWEYEEYHQCTLGIYFKWWYTFFSWIGFDHRPHLTISIFNLHGIYIFCEQNLNALPTDLKCIHKFEKWRYYSSLLISSAFIYPCTIYLKQESKMYHCFFLLPKTTLAKCKMVRILNDFLQSTCILMVTRKNLQTRRVGDVIVVNTKMFRWSTPSSVQRCCKGFTSVH